MFILGMSFSFFFFLNNNTRRVLFVEIHSIDIEEKYKIMLSSIGQQIETPLGFKWMQNCFIL